MNIPPIQNHRQLDSMNIDEGRDEWLWRKAHEFEFRNWRQINSSLIWSVKALESFFC